MYPQYKLYDAFYYFYTVVLSVSVFQKKKLKKKCPNNKKEKYNDKYRHTRVQETDYSV